MTNDIFLNTSILFGITVTIAFAVRFLRQPLLVAYLIAGIVAGPVVLDLFRNDADLYRAFSEFGIVLLLFVVGLNLNIRHLRAIGRTAVIAGVGQLVFTAIVGFLILLALPMPMLARVYLAVAITFSSTIIITKLLADKGHTARLYGRQVIGLMVVQDLLAIALLVVLSTIRVEQSLAQSLGVVLLKGVGAIVALAFLSRFLLRYVLTAVAHSGEFLFLTTVAWCFGVAAGVHALGFSLEVGALAAGISLAASPFQPEIASRVKPLRDFFLVLFFLVLGSTMQFGGLARAFPAGAILSAFILVGNPIILYAIYRKLGFTRRNSFLAGITAAQVSEFGFVLILTGQALGHLTGDERTIFTITALATFIGSTYLITHGETMFRWLRPLLVRFGRDVHQPEPPSERYDAWVFGYHRIGWKVCMGLQRKGVRFAVVDDNPDAIAKLRERTIPEFFGDASDIEFLESFPVDRADLIVSTIPDRDTQLVLLRHLRDRRSRALVIVTTEQLRDRAELYAAGADYVMMPHLLGGTWMADVLAERPWTAELLAGFRREQDEELKLPNGNGRTTRVR